MDPEPTREKRGCSLFKRFMNGKTIAMVGLLITFTLVSVMVVVVTQPSDSSKPSDFKAKPTVSLTPALPRASTSTKVVNCESKLVRLKNHVIAHPYLTVGMLVLLTAVIVAVVTCTVVVVQRAEQPHEPQAVDDKPTLPLPTLMDVDDKAGLSVDSIVAIMCGCIVGICVVGLVFWFGVCKNKNRKWLKPTKGAEEIGQNGVEMKMIPTKEDGTDSKSDDDSDTIESEEQPANVPNVPPGFDSFMKHENYPRAVEDFEYKLGVAAYPSPKNIATLLDRWSRGDEIDAQVNVDNNLNKITFSQAPGMIVFEVKPAKDDGTPSLLSMSFDNVVVEFGTNESFEHYDPMREWSISAKEIKDELDELFTGDDFEANKKKSSDLAAVAKWNGERLINGYYVSLGKSQSQDVNDSRVVIKLINENRQISVIREGQKTKIVTI